MKLKIKKCSCNLTDIYVQQIDAENSERKKNNRKAAVLLSLVLHIDTCNQLKLTVEELAVNSTFNFCKAQKLNKYSGKNHKRI